MPIKVTNQNNKETNNNDNADSLYQSNMQMYNAYQNGDLFDYDDTPQQVSSDSEWADFGNSMFDDSMVMNVSEGDLNEMRANNQGWLAKTGSALGNATVTAATTFLDNTVGFLWGIGSAAVNGDLSKLWDNDFSNAMADINDWANENMPYYTTKYDQDLLPFVGNFILNDLVRNSGFQIGTGLSMIVPGAILKVPGSALKLTKMASNFMKSGRAIRTGSAMKDLALSTWMSFGEASIEALNNKRDFVKYQTQLMNDEFAQKTAALDEQWKQLVMQKYGGNEEAARTSMDFNEYYNQKQELAAQKAQKAKFIEHEATKVGDITALANMAVLTPTNFMTFGKAFTGYNLNKRFGQIATDIVDAEGNVLKKNAFERTAKEVARTGKIEVKNPNYGKWGYNKEGKWVKDTEKYIEKEAKVQMRGKEKSALWEVGKNMFWEGNEEMMQEVGAQYSTALAETDMLNYEALAENGMAYDDILKQINSSWINFGEMANAFGKVYTDPAQYRQFFGGAFGMLISPHFTRKPGGGVQFHLNNIGGEMAAVREQNSTNALIAEDINKMLNSDESKNYLKGMLRHAALEHVKQDAVTADSKIDYENADFAQFVSDITTMSNAGKLPLLQAHLDGLRNMSDEELEETCMNMCTDKKVTYTDENGKNKTKTIKVGDFVDNNGNFIGNTPEGKQKVRDKLNKRIDRLQKDIDLYQSTMNDIDGATGGALDHETLAAFTWEKAQVMNKYSRAKEIIGGETSAKQIGLFRERIGSHITTLTDKLTQSQNDLKAEKERLSHLPKVEGKPVEASDMQKNLESSIKILTNEISIATELSQLCNDMQALQVYNADHKDDKTAVTKLFDKYADFAESMPNVAKAMGLIDENGNKVKRKDKNGKEIQMISSLEDMLYSGKFNALMRLNQKDDAEISTEEQQLMDDYADAAKLNYRARQTEASIDNLINDPTQYTAHRAELQQRILEHENKKTISKIQKEIEKGLDEGRITLDNLEEESKKITDSINSINSERSAARQLFDRAVSALSNTPYDELRQIAIRNIMKSKKYKYLSDMRDLINYVYMNIAANQKLSDAEKQVAMETFNKFVKGKKSIDEVHKSKVKPKNVDVNSLYVLDTPENQEAKRALIGKDPKISLDNYKYTEQSYNAAQIAKNEIPQIINDAVEKIYKAKNQPELADQLTTLGVDENKVAAGTETAKTRAEIDNKAKSIEQGINKLLETFKGGEILNNEEKNELFNKVQDLIDKTFNSDDYADEYKAEIDNLNLRWKAQSLDMIQSNLESRVAKRYNDTEIEGRIEVEKAFDEINKEVSKIQRSLEQSKGSAAFNDIFDRIAKEDYSVEPKNSFDIYYNSNGTIYRGHAVPCESLLNGRKCYAVAQQLDVDSFQYDIIDENGAIIGTLFSNKLVEPSKRGESIKLDFTKLTSFDVNAPNLQVFREITTLKVPNITSEKTKRDVTERCKACRESFQEDGILDENGETKLQSNILSTIAKANMIMNAELTESKAEIEDVVEKPAEIKKEHTGIKYFLLQDENGDMVRVMFPSNGNRVTFKDENGKTTTKKYSKSLFKKEGYEGVIRETYGNDIEIVESSQEEWNPKTKVETKQKPLFDLDNVDTRKVDVEIVDKPWKSDPTKSNKTLRIYIKNQHQKGYFELVKDQEDGYYSVHFKTATDNKNNDKYNNENAEVSTKYDRSILFDQLLNAIPDGSFFSTWGSLSPAGVKAVEKLGKMAGDNIVGYREVESKEDGSKIQLPIYVKGKQSEQTKQQSTTESKSTTETPTQPTVVEQKKQQRKKTEAKRKRAISQLDKQVAELDSMLERLQDAAKQNPQYYETVRTITTFKQYIEFVRNNYKALEEPKNIVLDENQVFSMMDSFRQQLGKIFGNDVQFLSDEEIEQALNKAVADLHKSKQGTNNNIQFQIGKKARIEFENKLHKARPDMSDYEIKATLDFLHELADEKENNAYIKAAVTWVANKSISLPQDYEKTRQIFDVARKKNIDIQKYKTFGELISAPEMQKKEKEKKAFNPDEAKTFSNKRTVRVSSRREFVVYDVENTEEGQQDVVNAIAAHYESSPWCLATFTNTGKPTESAKTYWNKYNGIPRKIAFENGRPVAFCSAEPKFTFNGYNVVKDITGKYFIDDILSDNEFDKLENIDYYLTGNTDEEGYELSEKGIKEVKQVENQEDAWWDLNDEYPQEKLGTWVATKRTRKDIQEDALFDEYLEDAEREAREEQEDWDLNHFDIDDMPFSKSNGEIYGFANEGKVVINKDKFRLDTPVHEYTHLWDKACMKHSPELWKRGVELMKQTDEWQKVIDDPNYANIKDNEDLVASEVHSRLSGMLAAGKAIEFAGNKRIKKGFWAKLIDWFKQFKDFTLRHVFGMSKEDAQKVTLEQFLSAPVADFMLGTDPRNVSNTNYTIASKPNKQAKLIDTSLKVGDTVQYSGVAKKAVVKSITSKGITIETDDGRQYKDVAPRHLQYLYGQKPSANAKFEDLDDAVSPEEYIARHLVGVKINDTNKDITNLDKKLASKNGKTIDELVLAIKDEMPFSISDDEIKDHIIDIASGRYINDIKQYAIDAHYAAQDAEYQAQVSAIDNAQTNIQGETDTFTHDDFYDDVDFEFDDEARNAIDSQIADEEYERSYQEYLEQRANEEGALTNEQWFEVFGEEPQSDPVVEQIKTKAEELKDKVENEVPPTPFNIINDESGLDTLKNIAKKAKSEEVQPLDTFKPAISEWWIDDKTIPAIVGLRKKYPKANFEYIYQLYKSTGAYDYVKEGKLRKDQEVYIGYGQVGKLGNGTPLYNVVFFVKDDKGNYQLIGTLSDTANQDPKTANELHKQVEKLYNEQDTNGFFTDITITNTKPYVSEASVRGQNVVVASGEKAFHFSILAPNGNPITTTVSKVLNGSLMWSETQHSLKDTTLPDGKTIAKAISENENGKHVRIGYFDASTQLHDNMTADQQQIGLLEGFRNVGSKTKGHIVLILNKPDGRYQLVPMHVALFGDLMDNPYNPIVNDVNNILKKAWHIYSDNSMSIDDKDFELTKSGGIIQQLNEKLHFSGGQLHLFFEGKNGGISLSANGKAKVKNADGTLPRPKSEAEFLQLFNYQLADCMININEKNISDPKELNKLIISDVFSTNLSGTDFRNAFFTVKPIDAKGKIKEVYRDMPEQYILKNNQLKKIYGEKVATIGDTDVYMCEDLDGDVSLYGVKQGTDEYNSDLLKDITTPNQRARMLAYAKIKAGMNPKGEFERKDIPADYIQEIDGKEYLVHPTIYGDEEYYDTETFVKQNPDAVGEETQESGQQASKPVTTYKPQEHKPFVSEKLIKDAFTSSNFAKAFIEFESIADYNQMLLKNTLDNVSKEQLEDYIQGNKQRLSTSTKRTMLSLESQFGIETLKIFAAVKDIYDSNVYSDLYDLLDSVTDADGNIDYSAFTQEQIDKVFDRNKIITDDNMFDKNKTCEAPF